MEEIGGRGEEAGDVVGNVARDVAGVGDITGDGGDMAQ